MWRALCALTARLSLRSRLSPLSAMADAPKRSSRTKKATDKVRKFDGHMRSEIRKKKLDALEQDNWQEEKPRVEEEEDEDYMDEDDEDVAVGTSKKSNKKKKKQKRDIWNATQKCKPLQEILDEEQFHRYPSWVPTWESIAVGPSRYPRRHFCSVTGLMGKYQCPVTGEYLATLEAWNTHRETRLKGLI
uniref:Vps72/YL1 C-terminal domain-containing protein n=1 Tax=Prymnesium polylepis TaxID=72548 RepID=A0A7S4NC35_9EUKA